jgi:hypothetical protein
VLVPASGRFCCGVYHRIDASEEVCRKRLGQISDDVIDPNYSLPLCWFPPRNGPHWPARGDQFLYYRSSQTASSSSYQNSGSYL